MISKERKKKYVEEDWHLCPHCGSSNIHTTSTPDGSENLLWVNIICKDCDKEWEDIYKLCDVEDEDDQ
jgi:formate dehydrogenase maturation protein FdhE